MLKLTAIVGTNSNVLQTANCSNTCKNTLLIKLKLNSLESRISLFSNKPADNNFQLKFLRIAAKNWRGWWWLSVLLSTTTLSLQFWWALLLGYLTVSTHFWTNQSWSLVLPMVHLVHLVPNCNFVKSWMLLKSRQMFYQMNSCFHTLFKHLTQVATWLTLTSSRGGCHLWWLPYLCENYWKIAQCTRIASQRCWRIWLGKFVR